MDEWRQKLQLNENLPAFAHSAISYQHNFKQKVEVLTHASPRSEQLMSKTMITDKT